MSVVNDPFANLPSISFANVDVTALTNAIVQGWQAAWLAETGQTVILGPADRRYHFLLSLTAFFVSAYKQLDAAVKQDLLPFSNGGFLDNITSIFGRRAARLQAVGAKTQLQFTLAATQLSVSDIPQGTQVADSTGTGLIFTTDIDLQIPIGQLVGYVTATCTTTGSVGNALPTGAITQLVNWTGIFTPTVTNVQITAGGAGTESDDAMRRRIFQVTDSYSNAGSYGAYAYFAQSADPSISQVSVSGPEDGLQPGNVLVTVLGAGGVIPNAGILAKVVTALDPNTVRDLCANLTVAAPVQVPYSINVSYYIPSAQANNATNIQNAVTGAVQSFIYDAQTNLGFNLDPSILIERIVLAGGARVAVSSPSFTKLTKSQIPFLSANPTILYLGLV